MGLFKTDRVQTSQRRPTGQRMSMADQQANELRYKAKSRLIGAIVLVILAVILVPMVMQDSQETDPSQAQAPLVAPQGQTDVGAAGTLSVTTAPGVSASGAESTSQTVNPDGSVASAATAEGSIAQGSISSTAVPSTSVAAGTASATTPSTTEQGVPSVAAATREQNVVTAPASEVRSVAETPTKPTETKPVDPKPTVATKPATKPAETKTEKPAVVRTPSSRTTIREQDRTDDGQTALALLEGRQAAKSAPAATPRTTAPAASGGSRFSIQLASHSTMDAARSHRERLSGSGVSNAYVQSATVNGRQTYRVRVGPFTSREAAQAAQTRLRGLGEGGFISAN